MLIGEKPLVRMGEEGEQQGKLMSLRGVVEQEEEEEHWDK